MGVNLFISNYRVFQITGIYVSVGLVACANRESVPLSVLPPTPTRYQTSEYIYSCSPPRPTYTH